MMENQTKKPQNPLYRMSANAIQSLYLASLISMSEKHSEISIDDIVRAIIILPTSVVARLIATMRVDRDKILGKIANEEIQIRIKSQDILKNIGETKLSAQAKTLIIEAYSIAKEQNHVYVGTEHLLLAAFRQKSQTIKNFDQIGINEGVMRKMISDFVSYPPGILKSAQDDENSIHQVFKLFGDNLVTLAKRGRLDPLIGRDAELTKIINTLSRRKKNNPLIIGDPGVGKTSLVEGLAQRIVQNLVPGSLRNMRIIRINTNKIMAGSSMRGDVEEKLMAIIKSAKEDPSIILFFDDIHTLLGAGSAPSGGMDVASILKPELTSGRIRCIGVTTTVGYRGIFEDDAAFNRRFQPVFIKEPTIDESIEILKKIRPLLEGHHNVRIDDKAIETAVKLSHRYITDRNLPDKAIDLLDESCATIKINIENKLSLGDIEQEHEKLKLAKESAVNTGKFGVATKLRLMEEELHTKIDQLRNRKGKSVDTLRTITPTTIRKVISEWTGIPTATLTTEESSALKKLDKVLSSRIIGQDEAIEKVSSAIKRGRTGISDVNRPWASMLFLGPTGVGKSELAKVLARELYGDENKLIQIDMSEFMEMHSVSKLIGSPPGYIGYKEGGQLTEKVRQNPYSVILFDEIEKAHEDVLNILLQILEYGHLTDGKGNKVSFKNVVIILTSNVGIEELKTGGTIGFKAIQKKNTGWEYETVKDKLLQELKEYLRPELLNRLDEVVVFRPLTRKEVSQIVDILITEFNERISEQGLKIAIDRKVKNLLLKEGFDQEYGARPLRRAIQRNLETIVADYIIGHGSYSHDTLHTLDLTVKNGKVVQA